MELIYLFLFFIFLELFEASWQKSNTLHGLILYNFTIYKKNIFLYFLLHATFFYTIFISIYLNNFTFWMSSILVIKFLDIVFKISLMKKLSEGLSLSEIIPADINMTFIFRYIGVIIYPLSFILATT